MLTRLIYVSKHQRLEVKSLDRILQQSRTNNVRDKITGALIIGEENFLQLLEGERAAVAGTFMRIIQDKRHHDIQVICASDSEQRLFFEWSMHKIETSRMKQEILARYEINGVFDPAGMTQFAIEDLCRTLSAGNWEAVAA